MPRGGNRASHGVQQAKIPTDELEARSELIVAGRGLMAPRADGGGTLRAQDLNALVVDESTAGRQNLGNDGSGLGSWSVPWWEAIGDETSTINRPRCGFGFPSRQPWPPFGEIVQHFQRKFREEATLTTPGAAGSVNAGRLLVTHL